MPKEDLELSMRYFFAALVLFWVSELLRPIENPEMLYSKMSANCFALGLPKKETKQQKKERLRKEKEWKRNEERSKQQKVFLKKKPLWRILPSSSCNGLALWIDTLHGHTFFEKKHSLVKQINMLSEPTSCPFKFPVSDCKFQLDFLDKTQIVEMLLYKNQEVRWRFKVFLNKLRIRRLKKANEVDPFTLETCRQPVQVVSYATKVIYSFEAESLLKHVTKRLFNNDGHIAIPLFPKNPLTNENFTLAQTISLFQQCRQYGHSSWPMEAFSSCQYNLNLFLAIHTKPLRLHALHTIMSKFDDWEYIDTLYDFIKSQHLQHQKICHHLVYKWAIRHCPDHDCVKKWRRICIKWYEIDILLDDFDIRDVEYQKLEKLTLLLCDTPTELLAEKVRANGGRSP